VRRLIAAVLRRRLAVGGVAAAALLAGIAGATPGAFGAYSATVTNSTDTAASAQYFRCFDAILADKSSALFIWGLADASGSTSAADYSGNNRNGTYQGTMTADSTTPIACPRDGGSAYRLDGSTSYIDYATQQTNPQTFTIEVYFQTSVKGGRLIGFGNAATGASSQYDRMLYVNKNGGVAFGVYNGGYHVITSPASTYANGSWHHAAATFSAATGMKLYMDGTLVASDATTTTAESTNGYWRVGYDSIGSGWSNAPTNAYFTGRMRGASVYTSVLTATQIQNHAAAAF
jgi:hypothetical protein